MFKYKGGTCEDDSVVKSNEPNKELRNAVREKLRKIVGIKGI